MGLSAEIFVVPAGLLDPGSASDQLLTNRMSADSAVYPERVTVTSDDIEEIASIAKRPRNFGDLTEKEEEKSFDLWTNFLSKGPRALFGEVDRKDPEKVDQVSSTNRIVDIYLQQAETEKKWRRVVRFAHAKKRWLSGSYGKCTDEHPQVEHLERVGKERAIFSHKGEVLGEWFKWYQLVNWMKKLYLLKGAAEVPHDEFGMQLTLQDLLYLEASEKIIHETRVPLTLYCTGNENDPRPTTDVALSTCIAAARKAISEGKGVVFYSSI